MPQGRFRDADTESRLHKRTLVIRNRREGIHAIATGLVVNWEGCERQDNTSKCLYNLTRTIVPQTAQLLE